jgi:hypothetical protein
MEFTVLAAEQKKTLDGRNGPMQVISLRLTDGTTEHNAEWFTKAATPLPSPNSRIEGTLEPSDYGMKFKKAFNGAAGGPRGRSPEETASIVRQHSQTAVGNLLIAKATAGLLIADDLTPANLKRLHDWYDDDVSAGVERKHPSQRMVHGLPVRNEPERTGAPDVPVEPYSPPAQPDGSEPFAA